MTAKRCDLCGDAIAAHRWHPVAFDADAAAIREFCSTECRARFLADESPPSRRQ